MRSNEADIPKTTFLTKFNAYVSLVMNFGMTNATSTFVTLINNIFRENLGKNVVIYLYNIIVFSKTKEQHHQDLRKTLEILRQNQLYAKLS